MLMKLPDEIDDVYGCPNKEVGHLRIQPLLGPLEDGPLHCEICGKKLKACIISDDGYFVISTSAWWILNLNNKNELAHYCCTKKKCETTIMLKLL